MEKAAPAESRRQAQAESGESIKPGEKPLMKGKRDDDKIGTANTSLKEDLDNGKARKEDRGAFLRRATGEGLRVFEGDSIAYGYRSVRRESARENARQIQEELTELGIDAEITDGYVHWNLDGISCKRAISQAVTIERRRILISNRVSLPSKNAAGHEAFHLWGSTQAREAYANEVADNLDYSSREFVEYQAVIAEAYLGGEADLSDSTQLQKLREELFAYISGDIHEGVNDDLLRPMFHDYDAVKAAWVKLCKDNSGGEVRYALREEFSGEIDSWAKDGMPEGVRFTLGSTGPVLQGLGAIESDIYMEGDKIQKILQDHPEMTLAEIKKVPQILEDPALILKSEGRGKSGTNSRLVCFGLTKAQNGHPVMTVMDLRPRENGFVVDDMQKVNSAYTKKNPMAFIQKSDVVYADKKRAIPLLHTTGLTISSQQLLRNGYIGSISYKGSSVNIQGVPFSTVVKTAENTGNDRHALREIGGKVMPVLDVQNNTRDYKVAEAYLKTLVDTEHPFATILMDAQPVYIGKDLPGEYKSSEYTKSLRKATRAVKMQAVTNLDEMLLLAENGEWRDNVKEKHKQDAKNGWYRYSTRFALPVLDIKKAVDHYTVYSGTLLIRNDADGKSYLYDLLDIKKEKVISSTSFSAQGRSEVFEPKPSQEQYMQNSRESQAENTGNGRHALRDVAMSDRDVLRRAADLALSDRKMNFTQADRERLKIFKKRLDILDEKQTQRQGYLQAKRDILSNSARLF